MSDIVACPQCGTHLQNMPELAGQIVMCPQCRAQLQMPAMGSTQVIPELPPLATLPASASSGSTARDGMAISLGPATSAPERSSVKDRFRRRTNPLPIVVGVLLVGLAVAAGTWLFLADQRMRRHANFARRLVGNWELVEGSTRVSTWVLAFHSDGRFQMQTNPTDLSNGRWEVVEVRSDTAKVRVQWPDDAPEVMSARLDSGLLRLQIPSLGDFTFRAATGIPLRP